MLSGRHQVKEDILHGPVGHKGHDQAAVFQFLLQGEQAPRPEPKKISVGFLNMGPALVGRSVLLKAAICQPDDLAVLLFPFHSHRGKVYAACLPALETGLHKKGVGEKGENPVLCNGVPELAFLGHHRLIGVEVGIIEGLNAGKHVCFGKIPVRIDDAWKFVVGQRVEKFLLGQVHRAEQFLQALSVQGFGLAGVVSLGEGAEGDPGMVVHLSAPVFQPKAVFNGQKELSVGGQQGGQLFQKMPLGLRVVADGSLVFQHADHRDIVKLPVKAHLGKVAYQDGQVFLLPTALLYGCGPALGELHRDHSLTAVTQQSGEGPHAPADLQHAGAGGEVIPAQQTFPHVGQMVKDRQLRVLQDDPVVLPRLALLHILKDALLHIAVGIDIFTAVIG